MAVTNQNYTLLKASIQKPCKEPLRNTICKYYIINGLYTNVNIMKDYYKTQYISIMKSRYKTQFINTIYKYY